MGKHSTVRVTQQLEGLVGMVPLKHRIIRVHQCQLCALVDLRDEQSTLESQSGWRQQRPSAPPSPHLEAIVVPRMVHIVAQAGNECRQDIDVAQLHSDAWRQQKHERCAQQEAPNTRREK